MSESFHPQTKTCVSRPAGKAATSPSRIAKTSKALGMTWCTSRRAGRDIQGDRVSPEPLLDSMFYCDIPAPGVEVYVCEC